MANLKISLPLRSPEEAYSHPEIFNGWKQIADYMGVGVRTAQRYERDQRLPIRRAGKLTVAIATKAELDAWVLGATKTILMPKWVSEETKRVGADFLRIDSETALTFSWIALSADDTETRARTTKIARRAYDTIVRLRKRMSLSAVVNSILDTNLGRLKGDLQTLGERFTGDPPTVFLTQPSSGLSSDLESA